MKHPFTLHDFNNGRLSIKGPIGFYVLIHLTKDHEEILRNAGNEMVARLNEYWREHELF